MGAIRFLILEDDRDTIEWLRMVLSPKYECIEAHNGLAGLQRAQLGEPDIILSDIKMPVMGGHEFVERLQKLDGFQRTPVIFLTALNSADQVRSGYDLGAALYLTKPMDPVRLLRNIELFIDDHGVICRPKKLTLKQLDEKLTVERQVPPAVLQSNLHPPPQSPPEAAPTSVAEPSPKPHPQGRLQTEIPVLTDPLHVQKFGASGSREEKMPLYIRILLVEDDPDVCQMIRVSLGDVYEVIEAGDGIAAIEMAVRYKPDLFIIDGMLPRMTGYQLTKMLRKNQVFHQTPIIFISGKATRRDQNYVHQRGHAVPRQTLHGGSDPPWP
jgi:CheY-like chemotaxis protein